MSDEPSVEQAVARHYAPGELMERIRQGLAELGVTPGRPDELPPFDELHIGGPSATEALLAQVALAPGMEVLDIGSGLGGTARYVVRRSGATVTGIDLTEELVETARTLSEMVGLGEATRFEVASALDLPFDDARFDVALLIHVGMNIRDKARLFAEARRVLKPGGTLALYEVMRIGEGEVAYPVPWAMDAETSFLATPDAYRETARAAGFAVEAERERHAFALDFFAEVKARMESGDWPPPLGPQIMMGETTRERIGNLIASIEARLVAPVEMILRAEG